MYKKLSIMIRNQGRALLGAFVALSMLLMLQPASAEVIFYADFEDGIGVNDAAQWVPDNAGQAWGIDNFPGSGKGLRNLNEGCGISGNTPLPGVTNFKDGIIQLDMSWDDDDSWGVILRKTADDAGYLVVFGYIETAGVIIADLAKGCAATGNCLDQVQCENNAANTLIQVDHGLGGNLTQDLSVSYTGRIEVKGDTIKVWFLPTANIADPLGDLGSPLVEIQDSAHPGPGSVGIWQESQGGSMIDNVYVIVGSPAAAGNPSPADTAIDVPRDVVLSWTPGQYAPAVNGHIVYFGDSFGDVNDGVGGTTQSATSYDPGRLAFGTTYYWRVDEVNAPPDSTVYRGEVWSFTTEPAGNPIDGATITATASSVGQADFGPEKTIDGSGLDADDLHSTEATDMWLSGSEPSGAWIQYEFDKLYKLHEMWVWNSNQIYEAAYGFGFKDVTVEYSTDGAAWTALADVPQFAQAPGMPGYAHDTTVAFGGALAKYVKLTATSNWGGILPQYSLSEVRFFSIPVVAREPSPSDGAANVDPAVTLSWRAGREAGTHNVYLSDDYNAVADGTAPATSLTDTRYGPVDLDLATIYFWRVDEANDVETPALWQGDVWSFKTLESFVVDDFDAYNEIVPGQEGSNRIFEAWIDGFQVATNGALVGHDPPQTSMETTIVHGGGQSVPFFYSNTGGAVSSEATRTFAAPQDWTKHGVKTLGLWFYGAAGNTGQLYVKINGVKVSYDGDAGNLAIPAWQPWNIDLTAVSTNLAGVTTLTVGVDGNGSAGTLYFDDIALSAYSRELITPVQPDPAGLVGLWTFDGNYNDSSGNGHNGTAVGAITFATDPVRGQVVSLPGGDDQYVSIGAVGISGNMPRTIACWAKADNTNIPDWTLIFGFTGDASGNGGNGSHFNIGSLGGPGGVGAHVWGWEETIFSDEDALNWHHYAMSYDGTTIQYYGDGIPLDTDVAKSNVRDLSLSADRVHVGSRITQTSSFPGKVDDAQIYNRVLSDAEIAGLAGRTLPFDESLAPPLVEVELEAEAADPLGASWRSYDDPAASGGKAIGSDDGDGDDNDFAPGADWTATYSFTVPAGEYKVLLRAQENGSDSFWVRIPTAISQTHEDPDQPGTGWVRFNEIDAPNGWTWDKVHSNDHNNEVVTWVLAAGDQTLEIAKREDGVLLDAILITNDPN